MRNYHDPAPPHHRFRKQDWFTVTVETLIVVFGVFIGLQVNNWNATPAERREEAAIIERLQSDFQRSHRHAIAGGLARLHRDSGFR